MTPSNNPVLVARPLMGNQYDRQSRNATAMMSARLSGPTASISPRIDHKKDHIQRKPRQYNSTYISQIKKRPPPLNDMHPMPKPAPALDNFLSSPLAARNDHNEQQFRPKNFQGGYMNGFFEYNPFP